MRIEALRAQLGGPRDGALLRYALGNALLDAGNPREAVTHLRAAVEFDEGYSAAWKQLGKACVAADDTRGARDAWHRGIEAAETRGDVQAAKEMRVFLKRLKPAPE